MFTFSSTKVAGFTVSQNVQYQGDEQRWKYPASGPSEQTRMSGGSIYANGSILYSIGDYSRIMNVGETWRDQYDETFATYMASVPPDSTLISKMKVVSPHATRYCVSPDNKNSTWTSDIYTLPQGETYSEPNATCIFVLSGEINFDNSSMTAITYRLLPANKVLTATSISKILIARITA